jgi:ABC-2 type transport system permease protein
LIIFLVPLIGFVFYFAASLVNRGIAPDGITDLFTPVNSSAPQGIVDQSGLVVSIPSEIKEKISLVDSEDNARKLISNGKISAFFIIPPDYLESGKVDFIQKNYNFLATNNETEIFRQVITNALFSDASTANRYLRPMEVTTKYLKDLVEKDFGGAENFWLPYTIMMMFYILIIGASSLMLNSITNEKKNRVIEILLTSTSPIEMLVGKTIALGIAGLIQTTVWLGSGFILLNLAGRQFSLPDAYNLPASLLAFGLIFFLLGYGLYSSLMAGLGALVPNPKEGSQATLVVIFPLIIPLFFSSLVATAPNNPLFVFFSLFPLTSPISMVSRMSATAVPEWQVGLSIIILIGAILFTTRAAARFFRAQELLSGKSFKAKDFVKALFHN